MDAYYVSPMKQELYEDWKKFAVKQMIPHTQSCTECHMVLEIKSMTALYVPSFTYNFLVKCPGCESFNTFTGDSHLPKEIRKSLVLKFRGMGSIKPWSFFKEEHEVVGSIFRSVILILLISIVVQFIFFT